MKGTFDVAHGRLRLCVSRASSRAWRQRERAGGLDAAAMAAMCGACALNLAQQRPQRLREARPRVPEGILPVVGETPSLLSLEMEHVKVRRTKMETQEMTLFEKFVTEDARWRGSGPPQQSSREGGGLRGVAICSQLSPSGGEVARL